MCKLNHALLSSIIFCILLSLGQVCSASSPWTTAYTYNGGFAIVYTDGTVYGEKIPSECVSAIEHFRSGGSKIVSVAFTRSGGYVVLCEKGGWRAGNVPYNLLAKLEAKREGEKWRSVAISSSGAWILVTDERYSYGNMHGNSVPNSLSEKNKVSGGIKRVECSNTGTFSIRNY